MNFFYKILAVIILSFYSSIQGMTKTIVTNDYYNSKKENVSAVPFTISRIDKIKNKRNNELIINSKKYIVKNQDSLKFDVLTMGAGMGLDYGGIGLNILITPHQNIGLFCGFGYAYAGFGYNVGARLNINPASKTNFFLMGMYGYNAAIKVQDGDNFNKLFYGTSIGLGIDFRSYNRRAIWSLALLIPIRDSEVKEYIDYLESSRGVEFNNELFPIGLSIGIRF